MAARTSGSGIRHVIPPTHQADATLSQANPVSGTKYTVLDTTNNCRIISAVATVTWTVQPDPLEIHVTIDGQAITHTQANPVSATSYSAVIHVNNSPTTQSMHAVASSAELFTRAPFIYEGKSIKIEAETTGGTVSNLSARVKYAKW